MTCREIFDQLNQWMPTNLAMGFDNVGFLIGHMEAKVQKILLAIDATSEVVQMAVREKVDLVITHHPLIFSGLKQITDQDITGKRVLSLIEHGIALMAMHTNYDIADGCMAQVSAERLGISGEILDEMHHITDASGQDQALGIGMVGNLDHRMDLEELVGRIKSAFALDFVRIYGKNLVEGKKIERVAISPGSGKGMYPKAVKKGAEVLITGDITHHEGIDAREAGICIIDAGHYGIEQVFIEDMAEKLRQTARENHIEILLYPKDIPDIIM